MAREQVQTPRLHRLLAVGAVALLAGAGALAFARVFAPTVVAWKLLGVSVASVALATVFERRSLLLSTVVSALGMFTAIGLVAFPSSTFFGLPTLHTFHSILDALQVVGQQARVEVAPTLPLQPLLLGAVTAVWTASFSAHALAIRSGSPFLAALPPAALLAFASMVLEEGPRPGYALLFLLGILAVLFVDGLQRVRQWGPLRGWTGPSGTTRNRLTSGTTTRGARRVAVLAVGVAAFLPQLLPGYRSEPILRIDGSAGQGLVALNPLVSVGASLRRHESVELFTVATEPAARSSYWRLIGLDRFDGAVWSTDDLALSGGQEISGAGLLERSGPTPTGSRVVQAVTITGLRSSAYLPVAAEPLAIGVEGGTVRYDPELGALVSPDGLGPGFRFTVESALVSPTPEQLDAVTDLTAGLPAEAVARYTDLPEDLPPRLAEIARELTVGQATPFRRIIAIQEYLQTFSYDLDVDYGNESQAMVAFLETDRRGFCQQFAGTMAVLLRSLGIPSRLAVGFTPGVLGEDGLFHVSSTNYHAWVEAYFPGFGWMQFEPTPERLNPVAAPYQVLPVETDPTETGGEPGGGSGTTSGGTNEQGGRGGQSSLEQLEERRQGGEGAPLPGAPTLAPVPASEGFPIWSIVLFAGLALSLVLVLVPLAKVAARRISLRRARSREPRELVLTAYRVFAGEASDLGFGRRPGETLWEHRARLRREVTFSDGHLDRLTGIAGRAAYSTRSVGERLAQEAVEAARVTTKDLRKATTPLRRVLGAYRVRR